jgi:DNA polymerase-3 subunit gamma/tau
VAYEALARKYRPRTFEEVVGQEPIVRTLTNAIREKRIHHAYVFSGMRGVGKTTVARIFAKALNCEKGPTSTPCLVCDPCVEIAAGRDLDVIEMDAASRTGVDDVRDLIDTTRYAPARDRYKVFIIDEFHMLSKPAFNALLKTLEEPPPRVVFVMATTELHKVLPTVLSRTQQFDFRKVALRETADQLARIAKKEGVTVSRGCLEMIARAGEGSVRDAESLLDQAIAFCGTNLEEPEVRSLLGMIPDEVVESFLAAAANRDGAALIRLIADAIAEGHDLRILHAGLIEGVRRLLLLATLDDASAILGLPEEQEARLAALARTIAPESLLRIFSILSALEAPLKYSEQPRFLLEAAAIRIAAISDLTPIEDLIARFGGDAPAPGPGRGPGDVPAGRRAEPATVRPPTAPGASPAAGRASAPPPARSAPPVAAPPTAPKRTRGEDAIVPPERTPGIPARAQDGLTEAEFEESDTDSASPGVSASPSTPVEIPASDIEGGFLPEETPEDADETKRFLSAIEKENETLAVLIEHAALIRIEEGCLTLCFDDSQAFARKSVEQPENLALLRAAAQQSIGVKTVVRVERIQKESSATGGANRSAVRAEVAGASPGAAAQTRGGAARTAQARPNPASRGMVREPQPPAFRADGDDDSAVEQPVMESAQAGGEDVEAPAQGAGSEAAAARQRRIQAQAQDDPAVKGILERFGGRIVEIKEVP